MRLRMRLRILPAAFRMLRRLFRGALAVLLMRLSRCWQRRWILPKAPWAMCPASVSENQVMNVLSCGSRAATRSHSLLDGPAERRGKHLVIPGVRFAHGHEQAPAAPQSNAGYTQSGYTQYRREHGEKAPRSTIPGQAISYRSRRDGKGWRVFMSTQMMHVPAVTDQRRGVTGTDLNADHPAAAETDASGNYLDAWAGAPGHLRQEH